MAHRTTDPRADVVIAGTGTLGTALARLFARAGRSLLLASRDPARAESSAHLVASATGVPAGRVVGAPLAGCALRGEIVVLATRWEHTREAVEAAGPFEGTIVIDATNPEALDGRTLAVGHTTSGAETIAAWAPGARVVKAFNHTYAELLDAGPGFPGVAPAVLHCGNDAEAKERVARLVADCGFVPVDAGPLASARYLEPVAALFVELVRGRGHGPADVALGILTRDRGKEREHVEEPRSIR
jgi:predicted dinucleotide-binding enzyme